MRRIVFTALTSILAHSTPAAAQSIMPPAGATISDQYIFRHEQLPALFGADKIGIICLKSGDAMPMVVMTGQAIFALNGNARDLFRGESFFIRGAKVPVTDPYIADDQRSKFLSKLVPRAAKLCRGEST